MLVIKLQYNESDRNRFYCISFVITKKSLKNSLLMKWVQNRTFILKMTEKYLHCTYNLRYLLQPSPTEFLATHLYLPLWFLVTSNSIKVWLLIIIPADLLEVRFLDSNCQVKFVIQGFAQTVHSTTKSLPSFIPEWLPFVTRDIFTRGLTGNKQKDTF